MAKAAGDGLTGTDGALEGGRRPPVGQSGRSGWSVAAPAARATSPGRGTAPPPGRSHCNG